VLYESDSAFRCVLLLCRRLLITSLQKVFDSPNDLQARLDCMKGAGCQSWAGSGEIKAGAVTGWVMLLAPAGMPHGVTSCVMLPHVLRYNASVNGIAGCDAASVGNPTRRLPTSLRV